MKLLPTKNQQLSKSRNACRKSESKRNDPQQGQRSDKSQKRAKAETHIHDTTKEKADEDERKQGIETQGAPALSSIFLCTVSIESVASQGIEKFLPATVLKIISIS